MQFVKISCPKCKSQIDVDSNFCLNCGFTIKPLQIITDQAKNLTIKSKYTDTSISKQVQDPVLIKIQIISLLEIGIGLFFVFGSVIATWIYYFMGYAIEYGKSLESVPFEFINIVEALLINVEVLLLFSFLYGIFCTIFGVGLFFLKTWGRFGTLFVSGIALIYFPIGTVIGGLGIYNLTRKDLSKRLK